MKVRNILIGLLVVLMAFVFISCEDEPEEVVPTPQPGPAPVDDNTIAKFTVAAGITDGVYSNEKIQLQWDLSKAFGENTEGIKEGSVLELQFRTSRDIHWIDIRTNKKGVIDKETNEDAGLDVRWIYEEGSLEALDSLELGEDGWYTLKYTFTTTAAKNPANLDYDKYYYTNLGLNFAGYLKAGDVLEVKNAFLDGQALPLTVTEDNKVLNPDKTNATVETVAAHEWTIAKTYAVVYALNGTWRGDGGVPVEIVAAGGQATGVPATDGFTTSYALGSEAFDLSTAINSDLILSYSLAPIMRTVSFDWNYEDCDDLDPVSVQHGTAVAAPTTVPVRDGFRLIGWSLAANDKVNLYDFTTQVTSDLSLFAQWDNSVDVILHANYLGATPATTTVSASLNAAMTEPDGLLRDGWIFDKWTLDEAGTEDYNFSTVVTEGFDLYAQWTEGSLVVLHIPGHADQAITIAKGAVFAEPEATPILPGSVFTKWTTTDNPSASAYDFSQAVVGASEGTLYLYAQFEEGTVVKMTATGFGGTNGSDGNSVSSYEKVQLEWNLKTVFGDDDAKVRQGDVLAFQFRSERDVYQYDLRTNKKTVPANVDIRWVYEGSGDTSHFIVSDPDENGWRTVTFTFGTKVERDRYPTSDDKRDKAANYSGPDYENEQYYNLLLCFRAYFLAGDVFEIKGVSLNGEEVPVVAANVLKATFVGTPDGPDEIPDTCAVMFVGGTYTGIGYSKDEKPIVSKVNAGETVAAPTVDEKVLTFFSDSARTVPFDFSTPITEDTFIYYTATPVEP